MHFNKQFLKSVLPKADILFDNFPDDAIFSIDSRTIEKGEIFIAIKGNHNDGHQFVADAIERGASGLIINSANKECISAIDLKSLNNKLVIVVEDTIVALKRLATAWRTQFTYPVIAITGSVGKTSTKEILENIFKLQGLNALVSKGNQNSLIGLPLNILRMRKEHQIAVFELGINKRNEMGTLVDMVKPTIGVITSIGHSHMEGLGSLSDIAAEKREIFKYFKETNIGIINGDQASIAQIGYNHPVIKFGSKITNQIQARKINIESSQVNFVLKIYKNKFNVSLKSNHIGSVFNALAATAVGCLLEIPYETIIKGIQMPVKVSGRFEFKPLKIGTGRLIDDCYNAGPESVKAALQAFEKIDTKGQKIFVFGDMLELGVDSSFWHRQIGRFLRKVPSLSHVILVGDLVKWTKTTAPIGPSIEIVPNWQEAVVSLKKRVVACESLVLVKGSTGGYTNGLVNLVKFFTSEDNNSQMKQIQMINNISKEVSLSI